MTYKTYFQYFCVIALSAILVVGCSSRKATSKTNTTTETEQMDNAFVTGRISDQHLESCGYLIEVEQEGTKKLFSPIKPLTAEFQKNDLMVSVKFRISRTPQKEGCTQGNPIIIEEIKVK